MSAVSSENEINTLTPNINGANGQTGPAENGWPTPEFKDNLGDHPLWQEFLDALEASRQADIAEANRLADLELVV